MDFPLDSRKALQDLEKRIKSPVPPVSTISVKAQVEATKMVVEKQLEPIVSRLDTLEIKTLIPLRDGMDGKDADPKDIEKAVNELRKKIEKDEMDDVTELMDFTWDKW